MVSRFLVVLLLVSTVSCAWNSWNTYQTYSDTIEVGEPKKSIFLDARNIIPERVNELLGRLGRDYGNIFEVKQLQTNDFRFPILAVHISSDVKRQRKHLHPMFKFTANIQGDDAVGYILMISLIQYLVYNYNVDPRITNMLNTIDIWIVLVRNPVHFSSVQHGSSSIETPRDIDGTFPDQFVPSYKQIPYDTAQLMNFIRDNPFVLSGNLKSGGAIVANYPFDNSISPEVHSVRSLTQDDEVFQMLATRYADHNLMMKSGAACNNNNYYHFHNGITNGHFWMKKAGTMQDFSYVNSNCLGLTFYLSCMKYPMIQSAELPSYWYANLESMLTFIESTKLGVYGYVRDRLGNSLEGAAIRVKGIGKGVKVTRNGEYWRILVPGREYTITASAPGFADKTVNVKVDSYVQQNFILYTIEESKNLLMRLLPPYHHHQ